MKRFNLYSPFESPLSSSFGHSTTPVPASLSAALELLPLLELDGESVESVRSLISISPRDVSYLRQRGVSEEMIENARAYRENVLREFDHLMERRRNGRSNCPCDHVGGYAGR